ncbi:monovalent cation/H+ antiporter subunit D [Rhizobium sp. LjRoot30]|uniref:monovalent cation/H+ antiporter subunit D n=1 Tax=Rhizobium sp. LjRoot30 TaxID=3342320 RepID=UPI003ED02417
MRLWSEHLVIAPILIPLIVGAILVLLDEKRRVAKSMISVLSTLALLVVAVQMMRYVSAAHAPGASITAVYMLGNWPAPFGIVLVADRLSAMMLVLTALLALASLIFSLARWHKAGPHFHTLFQLLLMGLNGAFLTGDLFNLFVFFEVMLAASYGLLLHGSGPTRVKAGLHYIAVNLAAALLFLIGVSLIYGITGTLNMADLAARIPDLPHENRILLEAGGAVLGVAFLVKAGMWPLNFWLPPAYTAAAAPVAAIFAVMSKLGVYVILRLSLLLFGEQAQESAGFGFDVLLYGGMITMAFGAVGVVASQALGRLAGYSVLVSSGTLLAAVGWGSAGVTAGALFYLVSSTLTIAAFFLLIELVERGQDAGANVLAVTMEAYGDADEEEEDDEVGVAMPGTLAALGICFGMCGILLAGLPPLSGFIAKFAMMSSMFNPAGLGSDAAIRPSAWWLVGLIILSGLSALIAMTRAGIRTFWASIEGTVPRVLVMEMAPVILLLFLTVMLTLEAGSVMAYLEETARNLHVPQGYMHDVMTAPGMLQEGAQP